jgi:hypothetical protein
MFRIRNVDKADKGHKGHKAAKPNPQREWRICKAGQHVKMGPLENFCCAFLHGSWRSVEYDGDETED